MRKKLLSILLVLCMALALLPGTVLAATASGKCGTNVTWSYNNGVLTIQGTGKMQDFEWGDFSTSTPWFSYRESIKNVIFSGRITSIGALAFFGCSNLSNVTIPDSVTSIGFEAFDECKSLTAVTIPSSVSSIGNMAFGGCTNLPAINVASGNPNYTSKDGVLYNKALTALLQYPGGKADQSYAIPNGVTRINGWAFSGCTKLKNVTIPSSITRIEDFTFTSCAALTSVTIPGSVTDIEGYAFSNCSALTDVYYGGSESQWKKVNINKTYNDPLANVKIHYNSTSSAPAASTGISVTVNSKVVVWTDAAPFAVNGRTMVPLRAVGDALGLTVDWNGNTREAVFSSGTKTLYFPIDSKTAHSSDGQIIQMDTAAVAFNGRTYAPVRYLAEYFGFTVDWDGTTQTVIITGKVFDKVDPLTLYAPVLKKYRAVMNKEKEWWDTDLLGDPALFGFVGNYGYGKAGYAFLDIDQNGVPELFIGSTAAAAEGDWGTGLIYALYTYSNGTIVGVVESAERDRYYLLENSMFRHEWSNGAADSGIDYYMLEKDATTLKRAQAGSSPAKLIALTAF